MRGAGPRGAGCGAAATPRERPLPGRPATREGAAQNPARRSRAGAPVPPEMSPRVVKRLFQREYRSHEKQKQPLAQGLGPRTPLAGYTPPASRERVSKRTLGPGPTAHRGRCPGRGRQGAASGRRPSLQAQAQGRGVSPGEGDGDGEAAAGPVPSGAKLLSGNRAQRALPSGCPGGAPPPAPWPSRLRDGQAQVGAGDGGRAVDVSEGDECGQPCKSSWARALQ